VSNGLSSIKPSATNANPEYAFNTVMTTANHTCSVSELKIPSG
jgi:hypothetical protein